MFDCDLHTHSRFFHFEPEVAARYDPFGTRLTLEVARRRGLDGIAVTNHDYFEKETVVSPNCLPGIEISTTAGHLLVVGPTPPTRTRPGELTPTQAVDLAHEHDCAAIIAHPFRNSTLRESDADFDAIEINGKHPEHRRRIETIARDRGIPVVGGSDAHFPFEVGRISTRLDIDSFTPEAVVDAIMAGRVQPQFRDGPLLRGLGAVYSKIHQLKGHSN
ncbi:PHP domain-containing protein [Haloferax sp. DFSO52]|uniref:PHP domain-containing protein n=1 Tax=Haloferax sp. DFSO52 TaxID=3388505 RepID=UPI003A85EA5E